MQLARRGLLAPDDLSLICIDIAPDFGSWAPSIARIRWDMDAIVRRIVRWANNVGRGREDRRTIYVQAEFVEGGTIGPAPQGR